MTQTGERLVYLNGEMVPESQAAVSVFDRGFRWGDAVYDAERTYHGEVFRLRQHMERLYRSLKYTRIRPPGTLQEMEEIVVRVAEANRSFLGPDDDDVITQVVTRGVVWPPEAVDRPNVAVYTQPISFRDFAHYYVDGFKVITPATRRTPPQSLSPNAKISNKMNHFIADYEAQAVDPEAIGLMLDLEGNVSEGSTSNFLFISGGRIKVPNRRNTLHGITMNTTLELAKNLGIPTDEGEYTPFTVYHSDEAVVTATSMCVVPVASVNGIAIGEELPGPITRRLWEAWTELTGVDIVKQAQAHASQPTSLPSPRTSGKEGRSFGSSVPSAVQSGPSGSSVHAP